MAWSSERKQRFFAEHPFCCFCVESRAQEIDHFPSTASFKDNIGPEEFEFPACYSCNHQSSTAEGVVALLIRRSERNAHYQSPGQLERLLRGIKSYSPDSMPIDVTDIEEKLYIYNHYGFLPPDTDELAAAEMVKLSPESEPDLQIFSRKLACALYYKELETPLPLNNILWTAFQPFTHPTVKFAVKANSLDLTNEVIGTRSNTDIGSQFSYRWSGNKDSSQFKFLATFGMALYFYGHTVPRGTTSEPHYLLHAHDARTNWFTKLP